MNPNVFCVIFLVISAHLSHKVGSAYGLVLFKVDLDLNKKSRVPFLHSSWVRVCVASGPAVMC